MKNLLLALCIVLGLGLSSCATIEQNLKVENAPKLINSVIPSVVKIGVKKQPKTEQYLVALVTIIDGFALGEDLTPEQLETLIKTAKIKELETPEAVAVVTSVNALYKAYYDAALVDKVNGVEHLKPILKAISDSIKKGLAQSK